MLRGHAATAVIAGAVGAALATAGVAAGGAVLSANGGNSVRACVNVNNGVQVYPSGTCQPNETPLDLARPVPVGTADALLADAAKDEATAEKVAKKARRLRRSISGAGGPAAQRLAATQHQIEQLARMFETIAKLSRDSHKTSNSIIQNIRG
jgi:hypothetical protein